MGLNIEEKAITMQTVADAAAVVARAADVASEVARRAAATASEVVSLANKTNEGYLLLTKDIAYIKEGMEVINKRLESSYVTQDQFTPVRNIVYGLVALIMTSFIGAVIALVIRH